MSSEPPLRSYGKGQTARTDHPAAEAQPIQSEVTMPAPPHQAISTTAEQADLEKLAGELAKRGLQAELRTPTGKLPYLEVTNPGTSVLTERVYAQADAYWYGWAEKITDCDDAARAADHLAHVLASRAPCTTSASNPASEQSGGQGQLS